MTFENARKYAVELNIGGLNDWKRMHRSGLLPKNMPACPNAVYKNNWRGWKYFLGNDFLSLKECSTLAKNQKILHKRDWISYVQTNKIRRVPINPNLFYKDDGWVSWYDFFGREKDARRFHVNDAFFGSWSQEMAYILGLWWSDGFIYKTIFSISLHKNDSYLLHRISDAMSSTYPVRTYKNYSVINIRSPAIIADIKLLGGTERKSLTIRFPNVPDQYLSSFIRGLWDGDGCITINKKTGKYSSCIVSGSKLFIESLFDVLRNKLKNLGGSLSKIKESNCYSLTFSKIDTIKLKNFLYVENKLDMKLVRKFKKFNEIQDMIIFPNKDMMPFEDARIFIAQYNIDNSIQWRSFWKTNKKPMNLPYSPDKSYKNRGWVSWPNFLNRI